MHWFKADLHIHTVLSPCGGLDMSPVNIVRQASEKKLDIIAITDHNSTKHCRSAQEIGRKYGITVLAGAEINTMEEVHCITFFENIDKAEEFQQYIDENLMVIQNKPEVFGYQYIVDEDENILGEEERLLGAAMMKGIDEIAEEVHRLNGIFIPAHINRRHSGIYNQLGILPSDLKADALEIFPFEFDLFRKNHPEIEKYSLITNSDSHHLERIGVVSTDYYLETPDFNEIRMAIRNEKGRKIRAI
jgi:PHP family Zn ribbon phosphoesterase